MQDKNQMTPLHPTDIVVKLGKYDLSQELERGSETRYPNDIIIHRNWKYFSVDFDCDIAMIILDKKVQYTPEIFPICLWNKNLNPKGSIGTVVGWGGQLEKPNELEVLIRTNEECASYNPRFNALSSKNTFCGMKDEHAGPCTGDSGSGLFLKGGTKFWYLRGIVSAGFVDNGRCDVSSGVVFSNVIKHMNWIKDIAERKDLELPVPVEESQASAEPKLKKDIYCFFESWAVGRNGDGAFSMDHLKPRLCTVLVFLHAQLDGDTIKAINEFDHTASNGIQMYKRFTDLKEAHPHLKTLLSIGSWNEGSVKYSNLAADEDRRVRFAANVVEFLKKYRFDGLHFHWESPATRGGDSDDKENFPLLLKEIHDAFQPDKLFLSAMVRTRIKEVEKGYDLPNIAKYVDAVLMFTFDYAGYWDNKVGFHAPIRGQGENNIENRVQYFIDNGVPARKIVLGIPFFGRTFVSEFDGNVGDHTFDGFPGPFFREKGFLGYNELCKLRKDQQWNISFNTTASQAIGKYKVNGNTQVVTFDSPRSVANKVKYLSENNLAGVWTWFVDSDDFRRKCEVDLTTFDDFPADLQPNAPRKERDFPLLRTINQAIELMASKTEINERTVDEVVVE